MSLLKGIAKVSVNMQEQLFYYNSVTGKVYFQKKYFSDLSKNVRLNGGQTGFWLCNLDIEGGREPKIELLGQIDEAAMFVNINTSLDNLAEILLTFNYAISDYKNLEEAISISEKNNNSKYIGFNVTSFSPEIYDNLDEKIKKNIKIEAYAKNNVPSPILKQSFPIDIFLEDRKNSIIQESIDAPENINGYILTEDMRLSWPAIELLLTGNYGGVLRMMLHGIAGSGKTDFARALHYHFSNELGYDVDLVEIDCSVIVEPNQWTFRRSIKHGETYDELTPLAQALVKDTDKPVIILLDEVSRNNPMVLNPLMQMLGEQKNITIGSETYNFKRPVLFYLTCNIGSQYTGTDLMDLALLSRMHIVIEQKPPKFEILREIAFAWYRGDLDDGMIEQIAKCAYESMTYTVDNEIPELITNRDMLNVLQLVYMGMGLKSALKLGIVGKQNESNRSHIEAIINNIIL